MGNLTIISYLGNIFKKWGVQYAVSYSSRQPSRKSLIWFKSTEKVEPSNACAAGGSTPKGSKSLVALASLQNNAVQPEMKGSNSESRSHVD